MTNKSIMSIAVGKTYYLYLAENLIKSFLLWNKENEIIFILLTNNENYFSKYKNNIKIKIQQISLADEDKSFTSKFLLHNHSIATENLFIDCDCLVYKDLMNIFEYFKNCSFSAIGNTIIAGDFFCDVKSILLKFGIRALPKFVGSVYYFKKNVIAKQIFECACELRKTYDDDGFIRLRGKENEEPLFAVAMALNNETLLSNKGNIKADLMYYKTINSNILDGSVVVKNPILLITGGEIIPETSNPAILHFNGSFTESATYKAEVFRLNNIKQNKSLVNLKAAIYYNITDIVKKQLKALFRPAYRILFGLRKINQTRRI